MTLFFRAKFPSLPPVNKILEIGVVGEGIVEEFGETVIADRPTPDCLAFADFGWGRGKAANIKMVTAKIVRITLVFIFSLYHKYAKWW